jgi:ribokinase
VVGSSNTDLIVRTGRLPLPGETVLGGDLVTAAGGKGANQAVAASRLGAAVSFVGRVGKDMFGEQARQHLAEEGLDLGYLVEDPEAPSGVALIVVGPRGQNIIAVAPGANHRLTPADVQAAEPVFRPADVILLQLETPLETVEAAARLGHDPSREKPALVILNPAPAQPLPAALLGQVDILTPNEHEAALLTGETDPEKAAAALLHQGVKTVVITLGEAGALLATSRSAMVRIPAYPVEAVDTTAAGDAFNGGLAVALVHEQNLEAAVRYASAVAAISVTRLGAQPSLPTASQVADFLRLQSG